MPHEGRNRGAREEACSTSCCSTIPKRADSILALTERLCSSRPDSGTKHLTTMLCSDPDPGRRVDHCDTTDAHNTSYHSRLRHFQDAPFGGRHRGAWLPHAVGLTLDTLARIRGMGTTSRHTKVNLTPRIRAAAAFDPVEIEHLVIIIVSPSRDRVSRHTTGLTLARYASTFRNRRNPPDENET